MTKNLTIPLVAVLALLVVAAPAEARKKPTERARIHALELQVKHLWHDLKDERESMLDAYDLALVAQQNSADALTMLGCFSPIEINELVFTLPGATTPTLSMTFGIAGQAPAYFFAEVASNCVQGGRMVMPS